jgi:hypothetical protein
MECSKIFEGFAPKKVKEDCDRVIECNRILWALAHRGAQKRRMMKIIPVRLFCEGDFHKT